jgi:hypothetical protein
MAKSGSGIMVSLDILLPVDGARKEAVGVWLTWEQIVLVRGG